MFTASRRPAEMVPPMMRVTPASPHPRAIPDDARHCPPRCWRAAIHTPSVMITIRHTTLYRNATTDDAYTLPPLGNAAAARVRKMRAAANRRQQRYVYAAADVTRAAARKRGMRDEALLPKCDAQRGAAERDARRCSFFPPPRHSGQSAKRACMQAGAARIPPAHHRRAAARPITTSRHAHHAWLSVGQRLPMASPNHTADVRENQQAAAFSTHPLSSPRLCRYATRGMQKDAQWQCVQMRRYAAMRDAACVQVKDARKAAKRCAYSSVAVREHVAKGLREYAGASGSALSVAHARDARRVAARPSSMPLRRRCRRRHLSSTTPRRHSPRRALCA